MLMNANWYFSLLSNMFWGCSWLSGFCETCKNPLHHSRTAERSLLSIPEKLLVVHNEWYGGERHKAVRDGWRWVWRHESDIIHLLLPLPPSSLLHSTVSGWCQLWPSLPNHNSTCSLTGSSQWSHKYTQTHTHTDFILANILYFYHCCDMNFHICSPEIHEVGSICCPFAVVFWAAKFIPPKWNGTDLDRLLLSNKVTF